jgi:hypothetical protein
MMRIVVVLLALALSSCRSLPQEYPPPEQRPSFEGYRLPAARIVNMDDPDAALHFVRDISPGLAANWRWTEQRPAVRIRVRAVENLKYTIDFTLPEATFKDTGPVTVTFTVNDHVLDHVRYAAAGSRHFEKAVPAEWIAINKDAIVGAEVDKPWISKEDGVHLGLILTRIGLTQ